MIGEEAARNLGRKCAEEGLDMKTAQLMFRTMYLASAMVRTQNNVTQAAEMAGWSRTSLSRALGKGRTE